jgi:hypothetical protein
MLAGLRQQSTNSHKKFASNPRISAQWFIPLPSRFLNFICHRRKCKVKAVIYSYNIPMYDLYSKKKNTAVDLSEVSKHKQFLAYSVTQTA